MSTSDTPHSSHITDGTPYTHPANVGVGTFYEHKSLSAHPRGGEIAETPTGDVSAGRVLQDRLSERLRALYQRARAAREREHRAPGVQDVVMAAHEMQIRGSSELTEYVLRLWLSPRTFEPPVPKKYQDAFIAAVTVMSAWAGEDPDLGDWCELMAGAAREAVTLAAARKQANPPVGRRSESDRITRKRILLATPESIGAVRYREFCSAAGLPHIETGYGLLLLEGEKGKRITLLTRNLEYASELERTDKAHPGYLQSAEIPPAVFSYQLEGWPDHWDPEFPIHQSEPTTIWLARMMREAGVNEGQLASDTGMTKAAVQAWLNGRATPKESVERSIKDYLKKRRTVTAYLRNSQGIQDSSPASLDMPPPQFFPCWQSGAAVLVGVSDYQEMAPVKSIANNLESLQEVMVSSMGIPRGNVFVVKNPESNSDVHDAVERAAEAADPSGGALLVYFAGHGWTDSRGRLMLGLVRSSPSRPWSAFDFNNLRIQIADSQIGKRVVILDSCYSGAALDILGQPEELASATVIDGTYVLTSANATTAALAPVGERFTTFTGHLVDALRQGIPQGPSVINTDVLFRHIERISKARGFPAPGRQIGGDGDRVEIMTNKWGK